MMLLSQRELNATVDAMPGGLGLALAGGGCHQQATCKVVYIRATGRVELRCPECDALAAVLAVAPMLEPDPADLLSDEAYENALTRLWRVFGQLLHEYIRRSPERAKRWLTARLGELHLKYGVPATTRPN
jgi:hypothetical protein